MAFTRNVKSYKASVYLPLALDPVSIFLQAIITLAPRLARSLAVSLPIPKEKRKIQ